MRFAGNLGHSFQILVDFRDLEVGACRATKSSTSVTNKQTFQLRINKMVDCYFHKCMCLHIDKPFFGSWVYILMINDSVQMLLNRESF